MLIIVQRNSRDALKQPSQKPCILILNFKYACSDFVIFHVFYNATDLLSYYGVLLDLKKSLVNPIKRNIPTTKCFTHHYRQQSTSRQFETIRDVHDSSTNKLFNENQHMT